MNQPNHYSNPHSASGSPPIAEIWPERIRHLIGGGRFVFTNHARARMRRDARAIPPWDILAAACNCELVEHPGNGIVLVRGNVHGRPLHIVCDYDSRRDYLVIVTAYEPNGSQLRHDYAVVRR